jgi:cysteine desulfurase
MPTRQIYLDHVSTTPLLPEAREAMLPFLDEFFASASSLHQGGLRVRDALASARAQFAQLINAGSPEEIIFNSNGTESANLAIKGAAEAGRRRGNHIIASRIEHPAVLKSMEYLEAHGFSCTYVEVDSHGRIDPDRLLGAASDQTILICIHQSNYDIGTIQPVAEIGRRAAERGIPLFVDASSSGGWLEIDVERMGISLLSLSPHRFYGPKGVGVLYRNRRVRLNPMIHGGVQEDGRRAGTENIPAIVGAAVAAKHAERDRKARVAHTAVLQKQLWAGLQRQVPYLRLNGPEPGPERISNQLNVSVEFVEGEGLMLMLDSRGISVASGTACASKSLKPSPVLSAIGVDESLAQGALILSPGKDTTAEEIDVAVETTASAVQRLRGMSASWDEFQRGAIRSAIQPDAQVVLPGSSH